MPKECYRSEYVRCGKGCRGCPHGPYWYAYWREGSRTRKRYVGKVDPRTPDPSAARDWREAINDRATATVEVACRILGCRCPPHVDDARHCYRALSKQHHPDRGGDAREMGYVAAAYAFLKAWYHW